MIAQLGESSTSSNVYAACDNILLCYEAEARFLAQVETVLYLSTLNEPMKILVLISQINEENGAKLAQDLKIVVHWPDISVVATVVMNCVFCLKLTWCILPITQN
jgi:hypothetical protein